MDHLSHLTLQLARVCKLHQRKALALSSVISAIIRETPQTRAALTQSRVQEMLSAADHSANQVVGCEFAKLEQALLDGENLMPALNEYLERNNVS